MNNDVVICDDDEALVYLMSDEAKDFGLNAVGFTKPSEALEYIVKRGKRAFSYLIDMKPYLQSIIADATTVSIDGVDGTRELPELRIPELIFWYLKCKGGEDGFYFMTMHLSEEDEKVIERTGANYFIKSYKNRTKILRELVGRLKE